MNQRDQDGGPPRGPGHFEHPRDRERYASREYEDLPSLTNRQWGPAQVGGDDGFGQAGLGGYGDFREHGQHDASPTDAARGPHATRPSQRGRGPRNYLRSDARIADDLIDRLTQDEQLDAREILVMVENGVVTLTGEVEARWMKHRAEDIAADVSGVSEVRNRLLIDPGLKSFGPPGAQIRSGRDQVGSGFSSTPRTRATRWER